MLKDYTREAFSQIVSSLWIGVDPFNSNFAIFDVRPKEVQFDLEVLGSWSEALFSSKDESSIVIFKYGTVDGRGQGQWKSDWRWHLQQ